MDTIARTGSFAAAARELGKVPSALTYSVRQLEDALDVLLFDRRSRQAQLTAAGEELLERRPPPAGEIDAVANRVKRVATGWETQLTIAVDGVISRVDAVRAVRGVLRAAAGPTPDPSDAGASAATARACACAPRCWPAPGRRCVTGQADLAIGVGVGRDATPRHRRCSRSASAVRVRGRAAPSAGRRDGADQRRRAAAPPRGRGGRFGAAPGAAARVNLLPGQDVLTVPACRPSSRRSCAAWAAASCPSRWRASTSRPAGWWSSEVQRAAQAARAGLRVALPARRREPAQGAARPGAALVARAARQPGHAPGAARAPRQRCTPSVL